IRPSSSSGSKPSAPRRGAAPAPERLLPPIPVRRRRPLDGGGRLDDNWSPNQEKSMSPKVGVAPLRREQIVRATIRCLARDGYAGLTMKKVARTAGVSQGILHYYFADKRAILVAALEMVMADLDRRVAAAQARGPRDPRARLRALITACLRLATEAREFWVVFVEFWGEMMHDRRLREINAALYRRVRRQNCAPAAPGGAAGAVPPGGAVPGGPPPPPPPGGGSLPPPLRPRGLRAP